MAADAVRILDTRAVVPLHFDGWAHYTEGADELERAFAKADVSDRLALIRAGETAAI